MPASLAQMINQSCAYHTLKLTQECAVGGPRHYSHFPFLVQSIPAHVTTELTGCTAMRRPILNLGDGLTTQSLELTKTTDGAGNVMNLFCSTMYGICVCVM